jgi:hypothetical protein
MREPELGRIRPPGELSEAEWRAEVLNELKAINRNTVIVAVIYILSIVGAIALLILSSSGNSL